MTVRGKMGGHPVIWDDVRGIWAYEDGSPARPEQRSCKKCGKCPVVVSVVVPGYLSCTGLSRVAIKPVDACIADLVRRLNAGATEPVTVSSCCGHGDQPGQIRLADGRMLIIKEH